MRIVTHLGYVLFLFAVISCVPGRQYEEVKAAGEKCKADLEEIKARYESLSAKEKELNIRVDELSRQTK